MSSYTMRVVVDGSPLIGPKSGVASYTAGLIDGLSGMDDVQLVIFFDSLRIAPDAILRRHGLPQLRTAHFPIPKRILRRLWARNWLPLSMAVGPADVVHSTNFAIYPVQRAKQVAMLHDTFLWDRPNWHFQKRLEEMAYHLARVDSADGLIVSTDYVKSMAGLRMRLTDDKIHKVPLGVADRFHAAGKERGASKESPSDKAVADLGLPEKYVLFVGTIEPRKNLEMLFKAFSMLPFETRSAFPLVLAGHPGWRTEPIYAAAESLQREGTVRFLGGVSDSALAGLYTRATLFVFPSLEEGFGLPPLEAMACGTPVIVSDAPALVEVSGAAAVVVSRTDAAELAAVMLRLLNDPDERRRLGDAGRQHAARFTWERTAAQTVDVYRRVLGMS